MTKTLWRIAADEVATCNCAWGCPCQFNALPTHGRCEALVAVGIREGHFGDTKLDGISFASAFWWPRAIHEGDGIGQLAIDERATPEQSDRDRHINERPHGGTMFEIFASVVSKTLDPIYVPIPIESESRKAGSRGSPSRPSAKFLRKPIRNPVTGRAPGASSCPTCSSTRYSEWQTALKPRDTRRQDHLESSTVRAVASCRLDECLTRSLYKTAASLLRREAARVGRTGRRVDGIVPRIVVDPATCRRGQRDSRVGFPRPTVCARPRSGTKLGWGPSPRRIDLLISTSRLNAVIAHRHGDLTATVQAGATLAGVNRTLGRHRQWIPLDPPSSDRATIGGIVATNDSGPRRHRYGRRVI